MEENKTTRRGPKKKSKSEKKVQVNCYVVGKHRKACKKAIDAVAESFNNL